MTDLELSSISEGIFKYLTEHTDSPLDGIAVLGLCLIQLYSTSTGTITMEQFSKDFADGLLETWNSCSMQGTERMQ